MDQKIVSCSFCEKKQNEVNKLIQGSANILICDDCIKFCYNLLENEEINETTVDLIIEEKIPTALEIKKYLDSHVIGQDNAKIALAVAANNHYKRIYNTQDDIEIDKSNVLLIGPSGTGKTYLARCLAKCMNVPVSIVDASSLTESGYVGTDVENILFTLLQNCNWDKHKAENGIIFIDEIDKKNKKNSDSSNTGRDISGEGVQHALLKMIEGDIVNVGKKNETIEINTKNILFIVGGAFTGLDLIVNKRINNDSSIGFGANLDKSNKKWSEYVEPEDLIKYGMTTEFIGRLPIIVTTEELTINELTKVLCDTKNSIIKQYQKLFSYDNLKLEFTDEAIKNIAVLAKEKKTGARGLRNIIENKLLNIQYNIQNYIDKNVEKIIIDSNFIMLDNAPKIIYSKKSISLEGNK